jgi:hypothetical protein
MQRSYHAIEVSRPGQKKHDAQLNVGTAEIDPLKAKSIPNLTMKPEVFRTEVRVKIVTSGHSSLIKLLSFKE